MSELLRTLAAYVPPNIIRETLAETAPTPPANAQISRFEAAILFADVSGFTPLTEALAQKGAEGPEELTRLLNNYFSRMIALIEAEGGEVVKFSGDAVTVVFPAAPLLSGSTAATEGLSHATRRTKQAAEAMQAAMSEFTTLDTSAGPVALGMKIGIGVGEILAMRVGGVLNRWEYVIAGDPLRQVAEAEHQAERGDIVLSPEAEALIWPQPLPPRPLIRPNWSQVQNLDPVESVLRCYVPGAIQTWLEEGLHEWLAVLRPMTILFVGVGGLDYTQTEAIDRLHAFLRATQETIYRYEGSINKLAVDDKGTILIALFGAPPHAHEDDPERALRCAMDLQAMAESQGLQLAVGVTTGRVFSGPVGSDTRREYTVMGDTVNLAARLMVTAGMGQVRCDYETYRRTRARLAFEHLPSVRVKGKAGLIRLYRPTGQPGGDGEDRREGVLVGRQAEVARLAAGLEALQQGHSRILMVEGEAGIGKSRLVQELNRLMREQGLSGLLGQGRSIEQQTPYRAWRDIFTAYFGLDDIDDVTERQDQVRDQVGDVVPEMIERVPLLNDVLNLGLPENELTSSLDTHLRHESLVSLLLALLHAWTVERPLVLVLEDAHWLDSLSWDLTVQVARAPTVTRLPLLLVVVMRPLEEGVTRIEPQILADMTAIERLPLTSLSPEETLVLVAARLGITRDELPAAVAELVQQRAGGNPFFAEELVYALRDSGLITIVPPSPSATGEGAEATRCLVRGNLDQAAQTLPDNIQGLVLSRIDRLPPEKQLTLKVAAVIGRSFAYTTLSDTLGKHMEVSGRLLKTYLDDLDHLELTPLEAPEPELTYIFKHIITQQVAYETLLFAQRRQLHRTVARWYERKFDPDSYVAQAVEGGRLPAQALETLLASYYPLLVYHWHQAEDETHERLYAWLAGQWTAAQFANVEADGYFSRALILTPDNDLAARYDLLLARESVNDLRGERELQARDLVALAALVQEMDDDHRSTEVALRQADYAEVISDYPAALNAVQRAIEQAEQTGDTEAMIEAHTTWGKVLWRQGDYETARTPLENALALARSITHCRGEAKSLYYLGNVYLYQNNYPMAQTYFQQALDIYRAIEHRQGEADSLNHLGVIYSELGDYSTAGDYYEQVLTIFRTTGDRRGEAIVLSNLGVVYCDLGDCEAAKEYHQNALNLRRVIGDHSGEGNSLANLGLVHWCLTTYDAARIQCEQALAIQRDIGDRRMQGYSLTYLGHALHGLNHLDAAEKAYIEAVELRRNLGQHGLVMDDLAALARVALAKGETARAQAHVDEILAWIETNDTAGIEYPLQVYFTCYQVLTGAANDDVATIKQADAILATAHTSLMEQAAGISDQALRRSFLENIKTHRDIITTWAANKASA